MSDVTADFEAAVLEAREAFIDVFLSKVPSYTGASRAQLDNIVTTSVGFDVTFNVPHFLINERMDATKVGLNLDTPGPYNALPAAKAAAEEVLENMFQQQVSKQLERITKWLR